MDCFMEHSPRSDLLARFLGGCSNAWTTTCKAAKLYAVTYGCCSCHYRFQYLLNLAEQDEYHMNPLVRMCCLSSEVPYLPVCFFWYARINCVIKHVDERLEMSHPCSGLYFHCDRVEGLRCLLCTNRDVPVWARCAGSENDELYHICSSCLVQTHQRIKHTAETAEQHDILFQRTIAKHDKKNEDENFVYTRELCSPAIYGTTMRTRINPKPCVHCQPTWTGWNCNWCGATNGYVDSQRLWYNTDTIPGFVE